MMDIDVLVIGRSCVDNIAVIERFPREDSKVPFLSRMKEGGGQGGTASCCAARLGAKVAYYGCLGDDAEGRFCLKRLEDFHVNTQFVEFVRNGTTPLAYIFITGGNGNRTIIYEKSALPRLRPDRLSQILVNPVKVILLDPEVTYLAKDIKRLAGDSAGIVYDCERWQKDIRDMMAVADYFIPSLDFLQAGELNLSGLPFERQMFRLAEMLSGTLVVTAGAEGAYYVCGNQLLHVSAPTVAVKDTTGAGDNFHAAFSTAVSMDYDLRKAVKLSVAVGSLSCREYGGREGIPNLTEALELAETLDERVVTTRL
jgi:sugar/nucleoside kinase (ribokinase family)